MRARIQNFTLALVLSLVTAPAVVAQSVLLRMNPAPGLESKYVLGMEMNMDSPMIASDEPFMIGTVHTTQTVVGVEGDVVEYSVVTDSMTVATPAMPMAQGQIPDQTGQVVTMKIDTRGRVVEMDQGLDEEVRQFAGQMGGMQLQLPEESMSPGDSWESIIASSLPGVPGASGQMEMQILYTLIEVNSAGGSQFATISFQGPVTMSGQGGGGGMEASGRMTGTMVFDVTLGRLAGSEMLMDLDLNAAGMQLKMNQSMTMTLIN